MQPIQHGGTQVSEKDRITTELKTKMEKKQYEKPEIVLRAPLEAVAADCSTAPGKAQGVCTSAFS
jgi:hypothetical protein